MKKSVKIAIIAAVIVTVAAVAVTVSVINGSNRESKYANAVELMQKGNIDEAYPVFLELYEYKDSAEYALQIFESTKLAEIRSLKKGDIFTFGRYEQDNNLSNGDEEIEWLVLEKFADGALIVSVSGLECVQFSSSGDSSEWEESALRRWLNRSFYRAAFNDVEKTVISEKTLVDDSGRYYDTPDKVFALSAKEANRYFKDDHERRCEATKYAIANGVSTDTEMITVGHGTEIYLGDACAWWLRSSGNASGWAASVFPGGIIETSGIKADNSYRAARPAMWIEYKEAE